MKAEHETCLFRTETVSKTHPRIELRGRLDSLNARMILLQVQAREAGRGSLAEDLEEARGVVTALMASEAGDRPMGEDVTLWGLSDEEIHRRSHRPELYYPCAGHILPHADMGRWAAELNLLRTFVREVELCACRAFEGQEDRGVIKALNRLSSAFYILTCKYLPEGYDRAFRWGVSTENP